MNIKTLTLEHPLFPRALTVIPQPPNQIYILGNSLKDLLNRPAISIVGSRKISPYGHSVTSKLSRDLASHGMIIVSGLALGVDSLAHQAALDTGVPTIAVLPSGLDKIYPAAHTQLAQRIIDGGGALISEYPPGTPPLRHNFIARNRLVSGLGLGLVVTEAAEKSGTIHTANFALEQGKTVFAVPGNITSPLSKGTNNLIKAGAIPVTETEDILSALNLRPVSRADQSFTAATVEEAIILKLLQEGITNASELQLLSKLSVSSFNQTLTMLEITGRIRPLGAGHWAL